MIKYLILAGLLATSSLASDIPPVSADEMSLLAGYDRPVTLSVEAHGPVPKNPWGYLIAHWQYQNTKETLHSYNVALFKGGTLFGTNRAATISNIEAAVQELATRSNSELQKVTAIQSDSHGRKTYFTVLGFGPGGSTSVGFTTLPGGKYDLMVGESVDYEDDMPMDQKILNPAHPTNTLIQMFPAIEKKVIDTFK